MIVIENSRLRSAVKIAVPFMLIPLLVVLGATVFDEQRYLIVSIGVALLSLLLFAAGYEKKPTGSRRMVIVAVMTALCIAGRFIPFFKPVTAITVITAIYLGGEAGFLVGALSALLSNFYFGQGPWTPFQMIAWGMIGLLAGFLANPIKRHKWFMLVYGVLAGIVYSLVMDIWTVIWYDGSFRSELYLTAILTALPHTIMYSVSNFIFLWFMAKPFGEKLERIKIKYGI
ncbi:MAG: ECF transporter S component [Oscillospiraceae bacterium]|nr:ECF transporter S component [Oscillospiraceae bacterium]